jgi:aminoglycoside phosphotransferase (APT) family kinase protein
MPIDLRRFDPRDFDIEDHEALHAFLVRSGRVSDSEELRFRNLSGGVSNRAVWIDLTARREAWVLKQALPKLRVAVEWECDPARIEREALGIRYLSTLVPENITPLVFENKKLHLLAMQAVPLPHENWKEVLMRGELDLEHARSFGRMLAQIHSKSWRQRTELEEVFEERRFFQSLRLEAYYEYSAEQVPEAAVFLRQLIADTLAARCALVHGDFSPKNVLIYLGRLMLLDHEVIHWGDPAFDAGFALTHFCSKAHHFPALRQQFLEMAVLFWKEYRAGVRTLIWAGELDARVVRHTLACLVARVAGRSPLEYLSDEEKARQTAIVLEMMSKPDATIEQFLGQLGARLAANKA